MSHRSFMHACLRGLATGVLVGCSSATTVLVSIDSAPGFMIAPPLIVAASLNGNTVVRTLRSSGALHVTGTVLVQLPDVAADVTVTATATDSGGQPISATGRVRTIPHDQVSLALVFGGSPNPDGGFDGPDMALIPNCRDAVRDGDETGIDCGGSCRMACPGDPCVALPCIGTCVAGMCTPATGPPLWLGAPSLSVARSDLQCATAVDGTLYAVGGTPNLFAKIASTVVELLQPGQPSWTTGPSLGNARYQHAVMATHDGQAIYAIGGLGTAGALLSSVEALSFGATIWRARASTMGTHSSISGAAGVDGNLYFTDYSETHVYSPSLDSWRFGPAPLTQRDSQGAALGSDGLIYFAGGKALSGQNVAAFEALTAAGWSSRAPLASPRHYAGTTAAPDGRIYETGGYSDTVSYDTFVQAYRPATNAWEPVASFNLGRRAHGAGVGPDGRLYIVGGRNTNGAIASVEAYGPVVAISPALISPGTMITVDGSNFAASAAVSASLDGVLQVFRMTASDGRVSLSFIVPRGTTTGPHVVSVVDARSQYPVTAVVQVP